jgi:hypothetical protein
MEILMSSNDSGNSLNLILCRLHARRGKQIIGIAFDIDTNDYCFELIV